MLGSSHLGVFYRTRSIVKISLSDRFKFFGVLAESSLHFPKEKKKIEVPKHKTSCFCN